MRHTRPTPSPPTPSHTSSSTQPVALAPPSFDELGALLGIDAQKAERIAASMLAEKRLEGSIDQPEARMHFVHKAAGADAEAGGSDALHAFDAQIEGACRSVETIASAIAEKHPEFALSLNTG